MKIKAFGVIFILIVCAKVVLITASHPAVRREIADRLPVRAGDLHAFLEAVKDGTISEFFEEWGADSTTAAPRTEEVREVTGEPSPAGDGDDRQSRETAGEHGPGESQPGHLNTAEEPGTDSGSLSAKGESVPFDEDNGFIYVASDPEGALVTIGDTSVGKTPITARVSAGGLYNVRVELAYFEPWEKYVSVYASEVSKVHADLEPGAGSLTVISRPQEADVYIDGELRGRSPLTLKSLPAGVHRIAVEKGSLEYRGRVEVLAGEKEVVEAELAVLRTGLRVESTPSGAEIYLDGLKAGTTPVTLGNVLIGGHHLVIVKDDSLAYADSIDVSPDGENVCSARLGTKKDYTDLFSATVTVVSERKDAYVYLDGSYRGKAPIALRELRAGEHEAMIFQNTSDGTYYYRTTLLLDPHETKNISVRAADFTFKKM